MLNSKEPALFFDSIISYHKKEFFAQFVEGREGPAT